MQDNNNVNFNSNSYKDPAAAWTVKKGIKDAFPVSLGYAAVAFSLGITAGSAGFTALQGFIMSLTSVSSSGEYAGVLLYSENAGYLGLAIMIFISNMRYILMSCAFSQKFAPDATLLQRLIIGFGLTDEIFGLGIMTPGYLRPSYMYAAICTAVPGWAIGTYAGVVAGDILPDILSQSLNVAIFGMFLAIIIPPGKKDKHVLTAVLVSFAASLLCTVLPVISSFSSGTRVMILTMIIASVIAVLFPVADDEATADNAENASAAAAPDEALKAEGRTDT